MWMEETKLNKEVLYCVFSYKVIWGE